LRRGFAKHNIANNKDEVGRYHDRLADRWRSERPINSPAIPTVLGSRRVAAGLARLVPARRSAPEAPRRHRHRSTGDTTIRVFGGELTGLSIVWGMHAARQDHSPAFNLLD